MIRKFLLWMADPQWGRRSPQQGPPDLDELWRNLNDRLRRLFGGRRGPSEPSGGDPAARQFTIAAIVGAAVVLWFGIGGYYQVDEASQAVILTFGKKTDVTGPGPHWRLPYPFQTHEIVNIGRERTRDFGGREESQSLMLTSDLNIIEVQYAVQFKVRDAVEFLFNNRDAEAVLADAAETSMREVVGKSTMIEVFEQREEIAQRALAQTQALLDRYTSGIVVTRVTLQNAQPPERLKAAFEDVTKAQQDRQRKINEGEGYRNRELPKAEGDAARMMEDAVGYRQQVIATAEGDVSRFRQILAEYNKSPAVTRQRMYLDTMQQVLSSSSKILMDSKSSGNMIYLPLDKLLQQAGTDAPLPAPPLVDTPAPPPTPESSSRSRESLRGRERESR